jgi:hypothetical protein
MQTGRMLEVLTGGQAFDIPIETGFKKCFDGADAYNDVAACGEDGVKRCYFFGSVEHAKQVFESAGTAGVSAGLAEAFLCVIFV